MKLSLYAEEKFQKFQEYLDFVRRMIGDDVYKEIAIHLVDSYKVGIENAMQLHEEASQLEMLVVGLRIDIMNKYILKKD